VRARINRLARTAARRSGHELRLRDLRDATIRGDQWRNRRDERALQIVLTARLGERSNCIDVGAHRGSVLEDVVRLAPGGRHIAVEPLPDHAAALARRFPEVEVHSCAASDRAGEAVFYTWADAPAYSSLEWVPPRAETEHVYPRADGRLELRVPTARLDALVPDDREIDLIKIDVEGAEAQVLAGAEAMLSRCRPVVALEHSLACLRHGQAPGDCVFDPLAAAGLRIFDLDGGGPYTRDAFRTDVRSGRRWFYFATPA
jgi:FkbM family methyltransferase